MRRWAESRSCRPKAQGPRPIVVVASLAQGMPLLIVATRQGKKSPHHNGRPM